MSTGPANHYTALKVERDADATTIKKAYFTLIRQFPPETHPEEFQKLREAYETLRDPEKRKEYDESTNFTSYGDDTGGQLTNAQHALDTEEWARAVALLEPLVESRPDLHVAADMLALAFLRSEQVPKARALLKKVLEQRPDVAKYHFHMGLVLHAAGNPHAAVDELWKALELDPKDKEAHQALINFARGNGETDVAVKALDHALQHTVEGVFDLFDLTLQKAFLEWKQVGPRSVLATVDALIVKVPADTDDETRKFLAMRLSRMAATCFSENATNLANSILQRCQQLRPGGKTEAPFPRIVDVPVSALPEARQASLRTARENSELSTGESKLGFQTLWKSALAVAGAVVVVAFALTPRGAWDGLEKVILPLAIVAAGIACAWGLLQVWAYLTSEHGEFRFVHTLFFVHVQQDRIRAWPLFTMQKLQLVDHHHQNQYANTALIIRFGTDVHQIRFSTQAHARQWAMALDQKRGSALDLLAAGLLEEDPDARFFPPELLAEARRKKTRLESTLPPHFRWYGAGAAGGVLLALIALVHSAASGGAAFAAAWHAQNTEEQVRYLTTNPPAPLAERIRAERNRRIEEARRNCAARQLPNQQLDLCKLIPGAKEAPNRILVFASVDGDTAADEDAPRLWSSVVSTTLQQLTGDMVGDVVAIPASLTAREPALGVPSVRVQCSMKPDSPSTPASGAMTCLLHVRGADGQATDEASVTAAATIDDVERGQSAPPSNELKARLLHAVERQVIKAALPALGVSPEGHPALALIVADALAKSSPYAVLR